MHILFDKKDKTYAQQHADSEVCLLHVAKTEN